MNNTALAIVFFGTLASGIIIAIAVYVMFKVTE